MPREKQQQVCWMPEVEEGNFSAAASYLSLIYDSAKAATLVKQLRAVAPTKFKAKDIFRASQLSLLGVSNSHVQKNRK